jgi:hypothetical protein
MNQFEVFIQTLLSDDVRVILFLPPYHPITYSYLKRNPLYSVVFKAEAYFVACAKKYALEVFGSYDPHACACDESDFCDWHHPFDSSTPKIFNRLLHTL